MSKVQISSSIIVPYCFVDEKTKQEVKGDNIYVMVSSGGVPRVEKATSEVLKTAEIEHTELCYDYKKRIITDGI